MSLGRASGPNRRRDEPAYRRIEQHLRRLIAAGAGRTEALPTEEALAREFGVSRMTARAAFQRLVGAGLVVRFPSRGTFVRPHLSEDLDAIGHVAFPERWAAQGFPVDLRILAFEHRPADTDLAQRFGVEIGRPLTYLERLRVVAGVPMSWDRRHLPAAALELLTPDDISSRSLLFVLPERGIPVASGGFELGARPARPREASRLACQRGATLLVREILFTGPDGKAVIFGTSLYPADRVTYRVRVPL